MAESETTLLTRTKAIAGNKHVKRGAIGGGAASVLVLAYQLFVTKMEFSEYRQEATRKASVMWQEIKTLENQLDSARMDIVRLQTIKTNSL